MAKNTYKSNTYKSRKSKASLPKFKFTFFSDRRLHLTIGFFMLGLSVFLLTSFISYLFTGKADQSVVDAIGYTGIKASGLEAENWLGLFGAVTAHYFIFKWFGIAAFVVPPLAFIIGFWAVYKKELYSIEKAFSFVVFFLLWSSMFMGFVLLSSDELTEWGFLSGGVGYELAILADSLMGWGTTIFLVPAHELQTTMLFGVLLTVLVEHDHSSLDSPAPGRHLSGRRRQRHRLHRNHLAFGR